MPVTDRRLGENGQEAPAGRMDDVESSLREFVRFIPPARRPHPESGQISDDAKLMVQRLSTGSIDEVERVIGELTRVRDMLRSEGERVQREISSYQALSEVAVTSMKIVAESLGKWQREQQRLVAEGLRGNRH